MLEIKDILPANHDVFPIMGLKSVEKRYVDIDLSISNTELPAVINYDILKDYISRFLSRNSAAYAIGGYLEQRNLYGLSSHFAGSSKRDIHLGVDIWAPAGHTIHAPLDGVIHSYAYNDQHLDYGYTIIIEHTTDLGTFYTLYGHLSAMHYDSWHIGKPVIHGQEIATLGDQAENGAWPPHLHFQAILDMNGGFGDFPGVCSRSELSHYSCNCPNPKALIKTSIMSQNDQQL